MIYDSVAWKEDLKDELKIFRDFLENTDFTYDEEYEEDLINEERDMYDLAFIKLQKFTIYSSIIIRKMIESQRLSDEVESLNFPILTHSKITNEVVNKYLLWDGLDSIYDLDNSTKNTINLKNLTNVLIHSFLFMSKFNWYKEDDTVPDEEAEFVATEILGFYFNSDWTKDKHLNYMSLEDYFRIVDIVINDRVVSITSDNKGNILTKSSRNNNEEKPDILKL